MLAPVVPAGVQQPSLAQTAPYMARWSSALPPPMTTAKTPVFVGASTPSKTVLPVG